MSDEIAGQVAQGMSSALGDALAKRKPEKKRPSMRKLLGGAGGAAKWTGGKIISGNTALLLGIFTLLANWAIFGFGVANFQILIYLQTVYLLFFSMACRQDSYENGLNIYKAYIIQLCLLFVMSSFGETYSNVFSYLFDSILPFAFNVIFISAFYVLIINRSPDGFVQGVKDHVSLAMGLMVTASILLYIAGYSVVSLQILDTLNTLEQLAAGVYAFVVLIFGNWWFWWGLNTAREQQSKGAAFIFTIIVLVLIVSSGASLYQSGIWRNFQGGEYDQDIPGLIQTIYQSGFEGFEAAGQGLYNIYNSTRGNFTAIIDPNFEQQVERQSALTDVGILLQQPYTATERFLQGQEVQLFSQLNAVVLEPAIVRVNCSLQATANNNLPNSAVNTQTVFGQIDNPEFLVRQQLPRTIVCSFDDTTSILGSAKATVSATYDWKTSGYTRRYYVSQQLLDNLAQRTRDPYSEVYRMFSIPSSERTPASIYTAGPMSLTIGTLGSIVGGREGGIQGVSEEGGDHVELILKFERKDAVPSTLEKVDYLYFFVPDGFQVEQNGKRLSCSGAVKEVGQTECNEFCSGNLQCQDECSAYSMYQVLENITNENYLLRCVLKTDPANSFIENSQLAIKSFRASASYTVVAQRSLDMFFEANPDGVDDAGTRFTEKSILSGFSNSIASQYRNDKDQIDVAMQQYNFGSDQELSALAKGVFAYFYPYHQGNADYCFEGVRYVGISGLQANDVFQTTGCPTEGTEGLSGNEQISQLQNNLQQASSGCQSIECQVGKVFCGAAFEYNNYNSCSPSVSCNWCHDTLLPGLITLAQQIHRDGEAS